MTVRELIRAALRAANIYAPGESPGASEEQDAFEAFRIMMREWSAEGEMLYVYMIDTHTLTAGTPSYTIGSGAVIDTDRPIQIKSAFVNSGGYDYPLEIIGDRKYSEIANKDGGEIYPIYLHYRPYHTSAVGTIYLWPAGGGTLTINSLKALTDHTIITNSVTFPGEYDQAIKFNLACDLCPEYGKEPSGWMVKKAQDTKYNIKSINAALSLNAVEVEVLQISRRYNINEG